MTVVNFRDLMEVQGDPDIFVVDVRDRQEIAESGRVQGSINIPLNEIQNAMGMSDRQFEKRYGHVKPQKDCAIVVLCRAGNRSTEAVAILKNLGFKNLYNYKGGWKDYQARGGPLG